MNKQLMAPVIKRSKKVVHPITNTLAIIRNPFPWPKPAA